MAEVYRKFGRTVRFEDGFLVRAAEAGEATEDGETFLCRPIRRSEDLEPLSSASIEETVHEIERIVRPPLVIERLVVAEGHAQHEFGDRRWADTTRRIHLSIVFESIRALIDLGDFDLDDVRTIASVLPNARQRREAPARIRLAPGVSAALLPSLAGIAPPNVVLSQVPIGVDGKGDDVIDFVVDGSQYPNWYRPSYRVRPQRMPFHLRATSEVTAIEEGLPRAIALLAPPDGLLLDVLCTSGDDVFPATVRVARIDAIAVQARWYPYGAGSFGAEMML